MRRKGRAVAAVGIPLIFGAIGIAWLNPQLIHYIESHRFRAELEKETAKGLHFPAGHYASIHRKGFLAAAADRFQADNGRKALRAIDARGITATFNPWGVFIRRWQLDDVRIDSGEVEIQTYTPKEPRARVRIGASISILTSNASRLRNGCRNNGGSILEATLRGRFYGAEKIRSWKARAARQPCAWMAGVSSNCYFWKTWRRSRTRKRLSG